MSLIKPFKLVKNLFTKPMTLQFPYEQLPTVDRYRGRQYLDLEKCIGCGICAKACPNAAIDMVEYEGGKYPQIHLGKCCFCALCEQHCPKDAITMTGEVMLCVHTEEESIYGPEKLIVKA